MPGSLSSSAGFPPQTDPSLRARDRWLGAKKKVDVILVPTLAPLEQALCHYAGALFDCFTGIQDHVFTETRCYDLDGDW